MSHALYGDEVEVTVVLFGVAAHLLVGEPGVPRVRGRPVEVGDPSFRTVCVNSAVSITGVEEFADAVAEGLVDPFRSEVLF